MLNKAQIRFLKARAHHLHPVVMLGAAGLSAGVDQELETALKAHELIKVKIGNLGEEEERTLVARIAEHHRAECVQRIGHLAIFYRAAEVPKIELPRAPKS